MSQITHFTKNTKKSPKWLKLPQSPKKNHKIGHKKDWMLAILILIFFSDPIIFNYIFFNEYRPKLDVSRLDNGRINTAR